MEYGKYVSLEHTCDDGRVLNHDANYEGLYFTNLSLREPGATGVKKDAAGEFIRSRQNRRGEAAATPTPPTIWEDQTKRRFTSFIVSGKGDRLLAAGHIDEKPDEAFLALVSVSDGTDRWMERLLSVVVKGGAAIDDTGRIFVVLENGELRCYGK